MVITKQQLASSLLDAAESGSLLTARHDPASASIAMSKFRTVLTPAVSSSLIEMFQSASFTASEYGDARFPNPTYVLSPEASYSTLAGAIPSGSTAMTGSFDRLIAVNGVKLGWHIFAESQAIIDDRVASGTITFVSDLP